MANSKELLKQTIYFRRNNIIRFLKRPKGISSK